MRNMFLPIKHTICENAGAGMGLDCAMCLRPNSPEESDSPNHIYPVRFSFTYCPDLLKSSPCPSPLFLSQLQVLAVLHYS